MRSQNLLPDAIGRFAGVRYIGGFPSKPGGKRIGQAIHSARVFRESANVGTKKTGKGRRKVGSKKRRMRAKIRHRK
jgi:hypothetical protein